MKVKIYFQNCINGPKLPIQMTDKEVDAILKLIGQRLRKLREKHFDQVGFAKAAGMNASKYGPMERGTQYYQIDAFIRVLNEWGIDVLSVFEQRKPAGRVISVSPEIQLALEQVKEVLESGGEDASGAMFNIRRWHAALPKRK